MYVKNLSQHLKTHKYQQIADDRQPSLAEVASKLHNRARPPLTNTITLNKLSPARHLCNQRKQIRFQVVSINLNCRSSVRIDRIFIKNNPARLVLVFQVRQN